MSPQFIKTYTSGKFNQSSAKDTLDWVYLKHPFILCFDGYFNLMTCSKVIKLK